MIKYVRKIIQFMKVISKVSDTDKQAKDAPCPKCGKDLFNHIAEVKFASEKINYCPFCGVKIEI